MRNRTPERVVHVRLAIEPDKRIADDVLQTASRRSGTEELVSSTTATVRLQETEKYWARAWLKSSVCNWLADAANLRKC